MNARTSFSIMIFREGAGPHRSLRAGTDGVGSARAYAKTACKPLLVAAVAGLLSFSAKADSLLDVYRKVQEQDPVYLGARHALQAARERVPQARALLLPSINLVSANSRQSGQASFSESPYQDRKVGSWNWNLQITQPLWRANSWIALDQARLQEVVAEEQFRQSEQDLILRTAQAYLDVLVAREAQRVGSLQVSAVEQQLGLARRNFEVGTATVTDVHEAQSRLDLSKAQAVAARGDVDNKHAELTRMLGTPVERLAGLRDKAQLPGLQPETQQTWVDSARVHALQVRIAQAALDVAEREISKSQAAHSPSLDLTAGYSRNYASGSISSPADIVTRYRSGQYGLSLNVPLFAGGGVQARVREAISLKDKAVQDLEAARRDAVARASQAFSAVVNGMAQSKALESALFSSKSAVDANKIGYRIGTRINIDVLNAEQQLYAAQRDWQKTRADTLMQGLRLKASNATLTESDLHAINNLLEQESP